MSIDPQQVEDLLKLQALIARAVDDPTFRNQLIQSPVQVLHSAGLDVDPNVTVKVWVNTATEINLVIPSPPPQPPTHGTVLKPFHVF